MGVLLGVREGVLEEVREGLVMSSVLLELELFEVAGLTDQVLEVLHVEGLGMDVIIGINQAGVMLIV